VTLRGQLPTSWSHSTRIRCLESSQSPVQEDACWASPPYMPVLTFVVGLLALNIRSGLPVIRPQ